MSLPSADELEQLEEIGANFRSMDFGQQEMESTRLILLNSAIIMHHRRF